MKTLEGYKKYQINRIAYLMQELCERRGYGIGEIGYNTLEQLQEEEE